VSFIGAGGEDWVELDMDLFERSRLSQLRTLLIDQGSTVAEAIGAEFEVEAADDGIVFIVIDGRRRYRAEVSRSDRLILTGILDPDGPL
jgi:ferric-dicitrate binding protein FerR (iron transport regulator)